MFGTGVNEMVNHPPCFNKRGASSEYTDSEDFDVAVARVRELYHGCWSWECGLGEDGHGLCATLAEAMAAVDAVLISRGQVSS